MSLNCRACEGTIYTEWRGGFCSRSCQKMADELRLRDDKRKAEIRLAERHEEVDASIDRDEIVPGSRARLIMEFKQLRGEG